jgi:hypothetical protein
MMIFQLHDDRFLCSGKMLILYAECSMGELHLKTVTQVAYARAYHAEKIDSLKENPDAKESPDPIEMQPIGNENSYILHRTKSLTCAPFITDLSSNNHFPRNL